MISYSHNLLSVYEKSTKFFLSLPARLCEPNFAYNRHNYTFSVDNRINKKKTHISIIVC